MPFQNVIDFPKILHTRRQGHIPLHASLTPSLWKKIILWTLSFEYDIVLNILNVEF